MRLHKDVAGKCRSSESANPSLVQLFLQVLTIGVIPVRITPPLLYQGDVSPWLPLFAGNKRLKEVSVSD